MTNRSRIAVLASAAALAAAVLPAAPAAAQTGDTIYACYVPNTGSVYRIKTPDTRPGCVGNGVEFDWLRRLTLGEGKYLLRLRSGSPPGDRFVVDTAGGFAATGFLGIGTIPVEGQGVRAMWYPYKGAFRAGSVDATQAWDDFNVGFFSWAGGSNTVASGYATFSFGDQNNVSGTVAAGFGSNNQVSGTAGFSAGANNRCTGFGCTAVGYTVNAGGQGSVALGYRVTANADYAVALGHRATAAGFSGTFTWGDASTTDSVRATANNQFSARAAGGYRLFTNATRTTGVALNAGGSSWNVISDRNRKHSFGRVDGEDLLARLRSVPVTTWRYTGEADQSVLHIGPMAQDWQRAFGFSADGTTINMSDFDGVNLAAIQALEVRTREVETLKAEVSQLRADRDDMARRLAELEAIVKGQR
ncbi:MAG TPA: tail fiber domain-containing protein [Longimicrobium sp.]|nr:tail fiber domain-containing protein [Longimicrobium sp.]